MAEQLIALCRVEHEGTTYNYGDVVEQAVIDAHPTAVGPRPLSADSIGEMSPDEMRAALLRLSGHVVPSAAPPVPPVSPAPLAADASPPINYPPEPGAGQ